MKTSKEKAQQATALRLKAADELANSRANVQKWHDSAVGGGSDGRGNWRGRKGWREKESSGIAGFGKCHATRTVDADGVGVESQVNSKRAPQTN